jgi:hypothetical protein
MSTPSHSALAAISAQLTGLVWHTIRTTPGLVLVTLGSCAGLLGHLVAGLAAVLAGGLIYHSQCGRTPYTDCARCHGIGHHRPARNRRQRGGLPGLRSRTGRRCSWCRGRGVRLRWGRAVMNAYRRTTHTSTTTPAAARDALPARQAGPESYARALNRATSRQAAAIDRDRP